jgi:hypothetical protein
VGQVSSLPAFDSKAVGQAVPDEATVVHDRDVWPRGAIDRFPQIFCKGRK